jgi:hypothetical protein
MRVVILWAAATAFLASAAIAGEKPQQSKKDADLNKILCRTEDVVGSKIPKRICMTRLQWDEMKTHAREELDERSLRQGQKTIPGS